MHFSQDGIQFGHSIQLRKTLGVVLFIYIDLLSVYHSSSHESNDVHAHHEIFMLQIAPLPNLNSKMNKKLNQKKTICQLPKQ